MPAAAVRVSMFKTEQNMVATVRDCPARLVPVGEKITIPANTFITITQSLGGNYTVVYQGNMARIDLSLIHI